MSFAGGVFSNLYNWVTEQASPPIEISKLQAQSVDWAAGLSICLLRDGTGLPTADIPWNSQKLTGLGSGAARTDAINAGQVQDGALSKVGTVAGTNTITGVLAPAITAYASGMVITFIPAATNTGATTINLNAVGAKTIVKGASVALVAGDLVINVQAFAIYDGTNFLLMNPQLVSGINVTGKLGVAKTLSTSAPSGGVDGDIWFRYV